eukprot:1833806-Prymnesium_polylepis.1
MAQLVREGGSSCGWVDALHRLAGARADAIPTTGSFGHGLSSKHIEETYNRNLRLLGKKCTSAP